MSYHIVEANKKGAYAGLFERASRISNAEGGYVAEIIDELSDALEAQARMIAELDDECQQSMLTICRERERAENAEARTPDTAIAMAYASGREAGLEEAAKVADTWSNPNEFQLRAGEMTAQERRSVKAVVSGFAAAIRQLKERT